MLIFPERTLYNRKIPKSKLYEKINTGSKLKDKFINEIDYIVWKYKFSKETINIEPADEVQEIEVFDIYLKQLNFSKEIYENIDKAIPYPILYELIYDNYEKLMIAYKKKSKNDDNKCNIISYFESDWQLIMDISLNFAYGLNLKITYENIIKSLMKITPKGNETIDETIEREEKIKKIKIEISRLISQMHREKQFNMKVAINMELQNKNNELKELL